MLEAVLLAAAVVAGITGAWSPCGLSMVETLAPGGYAGRLRTSLIAAATFAAGALAGGVVTFGGLSLLGAAIGGGSGPALAAGAALALLAALGEARGMRIVPQVRRQVPESWRRVLPVPVAAALYGVLLGLGFTTFILSFAVWALAGLCVALGQPALGLLVGLAFGAGRALPVILLAPASGTAAGAAVHAAMAERPSIYRGLRLLDAGAMAACAVLLAFATPAALAAPVPSFLVDTTASPASDPSAAGGMLAWQQPRSTGRLRRGSEEIALPGRDPVLSGSEIAWRTGDVVTIADAGTLSAVATEAVPRADAFAFSSRWIVWRADRPGGGQELRVRERGRPDGPVRVLESVPRYADLGRPSVDGERVAYHLAGRNGARIVVRELGSGARQVVRRTRRALLMAPTLRGEELLHVSSTRLAQEVLIGPVDGRSDEVLYALHPTVRRDSGREPGTRPHRHYRLVRGRYRPVPAPRLPPRAPAGRTVTLWSTALDDRTAYVTRLTLRGSTTRADVQAIPR